MSKAQSGKKKTAPAAQITDLSLTLTDGGNSVTTTVSPNAQWAGIQKFVDPTTNDGAVSVGNWNYNSVSDPHTPKSVPVNGAGFYRGWSTDFETGDVHLSNWVQI